MTAWFTRSAIWLLPATLGLPVGLAAQRPPTNVTASTPKARSRSRGTGFATR